MAIAPMREVIGRPFPDCREFKRSGVIAPSQPADNWTTGGEEEVDLLDHAREVVEVDRLGHV